LTAQIEPSPREGRELSTPLTMTGLGYVAMATFYVATNVAAWALLTKAPKPAATAAMIAAAIAGLAWLLCAFLEGYRHAE